MQLVAFSMLRWHELSAKAAVNGERSSLLGWDTRVLLAYVEGVLRQDEDQAKAIDRLYEADVPQPARDRSDEIQAFMKRVG